MLLVLEMFGFRPFLCNPKFARSRVSCLEELVPEYCH